MDDPGGSASRSTGNQSIDTASQEDKIAMFQAMTDCSDRVVATRLLEGHEWNVESATAAFVDSGASNPRTSTMRHRSQPVSRSQQSNRPLQVSPQGPEGTRANILGSLFRRSSAFAGFFYRLIINTIRRFLPIHRFLFGLGAPRHPARDAIPNFREEFEASYGNVHPQFVDGSYKDAVRVAAREFKFLLMYLHSPDHYRTPSFCREILGDPHLSSFIDDNFVIWGGNIKFIEGYRLSYALRVSTYPSMAVLSCQRGMMSLIAQVNVNQPPLEIEASLRGILEEQGAILTAARVAQEEIERERELRQEQEAAYQASLEADRKRLQDVEHQRKIQEAETLAKKEEVERIREAMEQEAQAEQRKEDLLTNRRKEKAAIVESVGEPPAGSSGCTVIAFKLPNGSRVLRRFWDHAKISDLYDFADSLQDNTYVKYSLVTSFPRRVLSSEILENSLHEAELHPQTQLFVQDEED